MTDQRWVIAFHEAGHGVTAVALGLPLSYVEIARKGDSCGRAMFSHEVEPSKQLSYLVMTAAGPAAELKLTGEMMPEFHHSDRERIRSFFEDQVHEEERQGKRILVGTEARIKRTLARAEALVAEHWLWISNVAGELFVHRYLTANDVRDIRYHFKLRQRAS